jgi:biotin carboxyl carrier protein
MSLINEALKRARTAGAGTGTADGPELQPVESDARRRSIITLPFIIAVVLVVAGVMIWAWYRAGNVELVVRGNSSATVASPAPRVSEPMAVVAPAVAPTMTSAVALVATPIATPPTETPTMASTAVVAGSARADVASTNVLVAAVEAPKATELEYKLEGIFYSASRPAAVINGELVHVGSPVEDGSVVAIDSESATVVTSAGQTNLLVLTR